MTYPDPAGARVLTTDQPFWRQVFSDRIADDAPPRPVGAAFSFSSRERGTGLLSLSFDETAQASFERLRVNNCYGVIAITPALVQQANDEAAVDERCGGCISFPWPVEHAPCIWTDPVHCPDPSHDAEVGAACDRDGGCTGDDKHACIDARLLLSDGVEKIAKRAWRDAVASLAWGSGWAYVADVAYDLENPQS